MGIRNIEEERSVVQKTKIYEVATCDVCKRQIYKSDSRSYQNNKYRIGFWKLTTGHHDWGNDSCDSIETFMLCSKECAAAMFTVYINDSDGDANTMYFEIEHGSSWSVTEKGREE